MTTAERLVEAERLFHGALEREPRELDSFLRDACAGDDALLREVKSLLSSYHGGGDFLESPAFGLSAFDLASRALERDEESSAVGARVGAYRLAREIGRGGMGAVYLAVREDGQYEQRVAVKLIKRGMDTDSILRRFRNERQILANLEHPHIARLLDGGATEEGLPYLVMEYVEGQPIDAYADAHQLSTAERLKLFCQVCAAVEYAHGKGVVHRDIKPSNILVSEEGQPKLLDFGIAKLLNADPSSPAAEATTAAALRVLTPEYASPEQARGERVTEASDVYSLGVVLYELLTGRRPFVFESKLTDEVARIIGSQEPEKPSRAVADASITGYGLRIADSKDEISSSSDAKRSSDPQAASRDQKIGTSIIRNPKLLRGDLDNIVLMALRKEPERRYSSVGQFSEDIRRHLAGQPVAARKDTPAYRGAKFFRRHKTYAVLTLAVAVVCLLVGMFLTLSVVRVKTRASVAVLPLVNASDDPNLEYLSDGITDNLIARLTRVPRLVVPAHDSVFGYKAKPADARSVGRALGVETVLAGNVSTDGGEIIITASLSQSGDGKLIWSKQYRRRPYELQALQQEMAQEVARELGYEVSDAERQQLRRRGTASAEAYSLYLKGDYSWNKREAQSLTKAADYFRQATEADPRYALAYCGLANSDGLLGAYRYVKPEESLTYAKIAAARAVEIDPELPEAHNSLALVAWLYDWDWGGADREFRRAIELNPNYPLAHHWYGLFLGEMGRADESIDEENRALELDPLSAPVVADMGRVYFFARRYTDSLAQFKRAHEMEPGVGDLTVNTSILYQQMGMVNELSSEQTNPAFKKALAEGGMKAYWRWLLDAVEKSPARWRDYYFRAELYARLGENERALAHLELAYAAHDHLMTQLKVNPAFDGLRSTPGFNRLLRKMNLDH
jgi:serine/threonine protein kinase/TolB-like protein/Tfp pilus assembly protein PilF